MELTEWLMGWVSDLSFSEVTILIFVLMAVYTLYLNVTNPSKCDERQEVLDRHKKTMRSYIRDLMTKTHQICLKGAKDTLKDVPEANCSQQCGVDPVRLQLATFDLRLEQLLNKNLTDLIWIALYENGFHNMTPKDLKEYCNSKGILLYTSVKDKMYLFDFQYPDILAGGDTFSDAGGVKVYTDIVHRFMELKAEQANDIKELNKKYSVVTKLNVIKKMIDKIKS